MIVTYGNSVIEFEFLEKPNLKSHYITVEKGKGVVLKGPAVSPEKASRLILKKAAWILKKLDLVASIPETDIVTGSRLYYLGKKYYVEVFQHPNAEDTTVAFNHSRFKITVNPIDQNQQDSIREAVDRFYYFQCREKILPLLEKWSNKTGLPFNQVRFRKLEKRWGSCSKQNNILINTEAIKLPYSLINYLLVHELAHTKHSNHSKEFWAEVSKHLPNWKELDERMGGMKM